MQIIKAEVIPVELHLRQPMRMAGIPDIEQITAVFIRLDTRQGYTAWGVAVAHPEMTGENPADVIRACRACADVAPQLNPLNIEHALAELRRQVPSSQAAICAFDLALHDLLGLVAGMPLHRILGGYRHKIQTSATVPISSLEETVEISRQRARMGYRMLKIKGGLSPEGDVERVRAVRRAIPQVTLRLDADGGYTIQETLDVARALSDHLEMLEQPTAPDDLDALKQVTELSPLLILADQSVHGPASALELVSRRIANGLSIKGATCGGLRCARQVDTIARAANLSTMISCVVEPALMTAAGLMLALSSPSIQYADLDGFIDLADDPTQPGFRLEDGWLVATDAPGLGCSLDI